MDSIRSERRVLPSGLRVITVQRPYLHTAAIGAFIRVGSRYERHEEQGLAHFLEHLLFRGSERLPDSVDLSREAERLGGYFDAWVHHEYTAYVIDVHRDHWKEGLDLLGEVLLHPTFTDAQVALERMILVEEMAQYTDSQGESIDLHEIVNHLMWGDGLGQVDMHLLRQNLQDFQGERVRDFYRNYYTAGNTVIVVAGDFDAEEAFERAQAVFGSLAGVSTGSFVPAVDGPDRAASVYRYLETTQVDAVLAARAYPTHHPDFPTAAVLTEVIGGGTASRLFSRVREERGLVYDIGADIVAYQDVGSIKISTYCTLQNLRLTLSAVFDVLDEISDRGIEEDELERARGVVRASADYLLDSPFELADWFGRTEVLHAPKLLPDPRRETERFTSVQMDDVWRVIRNVLRPPNRYLAVVGPLAWRDKRQFETLFRSRTRDRASSTTA